MTRKFTRRTALGAAAATAASLAVRGSWATDLSLVEPAGGRRKVLEIFLRGGASFWSSFWHNTILGGPASAEGTEDSELGGDWACITGADCGGPLPLVYKWPAGSTTFIGKAASPLVTKYFDSQSASNRWLAQYMRILRVGHDLIPHEAAIPYAATGSTVGRPKMSGLGPAIWHAADQRSGTGLYSIIMRAGDRANDRLAASYMATYGEHGAQYRPPILPLGDPFFHQALPRAGHTDTDALKLFYRNRYNDRMKSGTELVRSEGWSSYFASLDTMLVHYQALENLFTDDQVTALFDDIGTVDYLNNRTRNAITTAVDLLSDTALEHIAIVDGGVEADYDTHNAVAVGEPEEIQNGNIWNVCDALASCTNSLLDNGIAVLIHTEFGRRENDSANTGTEHHPRGYVNVVISDLIGEQLLVGDAVVGTNEPVDNPAAFATYETAPGDDPQPLTPTDVHAAMLQVAGIDPIASELLDDDLKRLPGADAALDLLGIS